MFIKIAKHDLLIIDDFGLESARKGQYRDFLELVEDDPIPIIAGIWPFTSYKNAEFMANEVPGVVVPPELLDKMHQTQTRQASRKLGIEIAREMMDKIYDHVAGFAVSAPFGNVNTALAVLGKIDIEDIR